MNDKLFWFSGSGNSLYAAKRIGKALGDIEIAPIKESFSLYGKIDTLYMVFPIYGWGPPLIIRRFIDRLPQKYAKNAICIYTYGGDAGPVSRIIKKLLKVKDISLQASYGIKTIDNYPPFGGAPAEDVQKIKLDEEEEQLEEIIENLKDNPSGNHEDAKIYFKIVGSIIQALFQQGLKTADKKFHFTDKCTKCGICKKICPVDNIEIDKNGPSWLGHCEQCFACFHWCPEEAIEFGKKSKGQIRYHHPGIQRKEFID
ncbi:MAG: EFR1 family ferrodoxin [Candidatus Zixiibacteriota bacterium]